MAASTPPPKVMQEDLPAGARALKDRLAKKRAALRDARERAIEHLRLFNDWNQPTNSAAFDQQFPAKARRLMYESGLRQCDYDDAAADYIQALHEENMRLVHENNLETRKLALSQVRANRIMTALTVVIAIATGIQAYYMSRQTSQPSPASVSPSITSPPSR